jgi:hypothetical protein
MTVVFEYQLLVKTGVFSGQKAERREASILLIEIICFSLAVFTHVL